MANRAITVLACVLLATFISSSALAKSIARPGYSGVDEYLETVPTSKGNSSQPAARSKPSLTPNTIRRFDQVDSASGAHLGHSTQALAEAFAPPPSKTGVRMEPLPKQALGLAAVNALLGTGFIPVFLIIALVVLVGIPLTRKFITRKRAQ